MESDRQIYNETNYPHDHALTKSFVVKITVERCDKINIGSFANFDRVKSVALYTQISENWARATRATAPQLLKLFVFVMHI